MLIVDGSRVPTHDPSVAERSKNRRYCTNHQAVIKDVVGPTRSVCWAACSDSPFRWLVERPLVQPARLGGIQLWSAPEYRSAI
ncbi:hypothetical protein [Streptomyces fulvorobeus]|uniref:Uncharacterized protein n=1 Tax=Streptomyces fulvorobeus TaxID=284028 RepID=A0A7J0CF02_9ACTN|nr:hypothetical protein [Streptomyces fulvorobeus]GFN01046.1 hypothetical protein Sfulv_58560 [Streptomyces fulvorobeus]